MQTQHIHIEGLVQGVGFRPFVYQLATRLGLSGTVSNGPDGLHIICTGEEKKIQDLLNACVQTPPAHALIRNYSFTEKLLTHFSEFSIIPSEQGGKPNLLLTPDRAICSSCLKELKSVNNKRYQYPFITCLQCGPRFSIITGLPYDRALTTMAPLPMCSNCEEEYQNPTDRRHYSQTNTCADCCIPMKLFNQQGEQIAKDPASILELVNSALAEGHIVAVKGIGGYLLLCDATKQLSIHQLRSRKHRPAKPLAVLYPSLSMASADLHIANCEQEALVSKEAPIVLCSIKDELPSGLCAEALAPGLGSVGIMLPYTGLLDLIASTFNKPLVATSGNLSGSPIIYTDEDAICYLTDYADYILTYEREIVMPQDDSVIQFTPLSKRRIILRRSRGMAPNYFPSPINLEQTILAMGADLKSSFTIADNKNVYVSQFLGDQSGYEAQLSYQHTLKHFLSLLQVKPSRILVDSHPGYHTAVMGKELASEWMIPVQCVQHHKAHFGAVLVENNLLESTDSIMGVIWDGTGYGDDAQIWGGEFFVYNKGTIVREAHLAYFPQLVGDKMSKEPRLSALSLLYKNPQVFDYLKDLFTEEEIHFYQKLIQQPATLHTSSMGRLLDGIAAILKIKWINSYEGEAAMLMQAMAEKEFDWRPNDDSIFNESYSLPLAEGRVDWATLILQILNDSKLGVAPSKIVQKLYVTLVLLIEKVAQQQNCRQIAFSGGVFQNAILVDLIYLRLHTTHKLYFHQQLSPNDECIGFGQLAIHSIDKKEISQS